MKNYNLSKIMKRAWEIRRQHKDNDFALSLRMSWEEAKTTGSNILTVKAWVIDKAQDTASRYNCFIDYAERGVDHTRLEVNGYIKVIVEERLGETEKAVKVRLRTGDIVGSVKGWTLWIPKSQIAA